MSFEPNYASKVKSNVADTGVITLVAAPVAGTITAGPTFNMVGRRPVMGTLSAYVDVDAETSTITLSAVWEVSRNGTTWIRCSPAVNNAAEVVLATGTAGADANVVRSIPAPPQVYGFRYCRCSILNGVVTGAAVDTYRIGYDYCEQ